MTDVKPAQTALHAWQGPPVSELALRPACIGPCLSMLTLQAKAPVQEISDVSSSDSDMAALDREVRRSNIRHLPMYGKLFVLHIIWDVYGVCHICGDVLLIAHLGALQEAL